LKSKKKLSRVLEGNLIQRVDPKVLIENIHSRKSIKEEIIK